MEKEDLRKRVKARLDRLTEEETDCFSGLVIRNLKNLFISLSISDSWAILCYYPYFKGEPRLNSFYLDLNNSGLKTFFPEVVNENILHFFLADPGLAKRFNLKVVSKKQSNKFSSSAILDNDKKIGSSELTTFNSSANPYNTDFTESNRRVSLVLFNQSDFEKVVVLVPGLCFSSKGERLGRGKGYYDRFLDSLQNYISIGVFFSLQKEAFIPSEPHDVNLDYIVTEENIFNCI